MGINSFINNISVDCVIFGFHDRTLSVLLTKRELTDPETGAILISDYTMQGHHVIVGENLDDAAKRVLKEKTGLDNIFLKQFHTFGDTDRLTNKKDQLWLKSMYPMISDYVISVGYYSLVNSSKVTPQPDHPYTRWFPVNKLPELAFDHENIIRKALEHLHREIRYEPIGFELLPEKFTLTELQWLYEAVLGITLDRRNFRKKVAQMKYLIALDEKQNGVAHKPAQLYIFSRDVYERTKKEKLDFSL